MSNSKKQILKFESIPRTNIPKIIVSKIKEKIFSGELKPGDKLPSERELVNNFKTSRITIREAIRMLETVGLVEVKRGKEGGSFVKEINSAYYADFLSDMLVQGLLNISEITETRLMLEPGIAKLSAKRANEEDISRMRECINEAKLYILEKKRPRSININFHNLVARSIHNKMIYFEVTSITRIMTKNVDYSTLDNHDVLSTIKRHEKIFNAIRMHKPEEAFKEMYNDIEMVHLALKKNE
ncbi:MAG: FadR family transcriptional regulator [Actinobacteria bacterium]|nr:FadR family transcriptional regulator [Actinomycetota bacterium]